MKQNRLQIASQIMLFSSVLLACTPVGQYESPLVAAAKVNETLMNPDDFARAQQQQAENNAVQEKDNSSTAETNSSSGIINTSQASTLACDNPVKGAKTNCLIIPSVGWGVTKCTINQGIPSLTGRVFNVSAGETSFETIFDQSGKVEIVLACDYNGNMGLGTTTHIDQTVVDVSDF